ncbi:MAG: DUF1501 domain-containing protein, partial [Chloroherpetonaceae bacterium]|nr:DUF1501 domain-containing protein [Chloroherpetonaceae bacterium]
MNRRKFLKTASLLGVPLALNGLPISAVAQPSLLDVLSTLPNDRVLVIVQLSGGNDGLNTVIPLDQYGTYQQLRSNIAIAENRVLRLTPATGLHPAMTALKTLYDEGKVAIVQGVSYPSPNLSHFRATDIWMTASDSNQFLDSGWAGRFLESLYPNFPDGYPNATMPDPPAIQIGATPSLMLRGSGQSLGIPIQDPETFYRLVSGNSADEQSDVPDTAAGDELRYIRRVAVQSIQYANQIKAAADRAQNRATYPAPNSNRLADQLRIVARLIAGGLRTRVYHVSLGGFDTHAAQVVTTDTSTGTHANLLGWLSQALAAFQDDLRQLGVAHRVLTMTFSEFGRTVRSNGSVGTDHGTAAPLFLVGEAVRGGIIGTNPNLTNLVNNQLAMQFDFRQVYASVLGQWFGVSQSSLRAILQREFAQLPITSVSSVSEA